MKTCRVLIVGDHRLFCENLSALLWRRRGIRVLDVVPMARVVEYAARLKPDAVIVDSTASLSLAELLEANDREFRLITVTLEHNQLVVYSKLVLDNAGTDDLIAAIKKVQLPSTRLA